MNNVRVIYVPGLGDSFDPFRRRMLKLWKLWGIDATLVPMRWSANERYEDKYKRLMNELKKYENVIVIGESAGATTALRAFSEVESVRQCLTLCGVCQPTAQIGDVYNTRAPALRQAAKNIPATFQNTDMLMSIYSPLDFTVVSKNSVATGATCRKLYMPGHMPTIGFGLLVYLPLCLKYRQK